MKSTLIKGLLQATDPGSDEGVGVGLVPFVVLEDLGLPEQVPLNMCWFGIQIPGCPWAF